MEFAIKTLVVIALCIIGALVMILFIQVWSGKSANIVDSSYDFFNNLVGMPK